MARKLLTLEINGLIISKYINMEALQTDIPIIDVPSIPKPKPVISQYRVVEIISAANELPNANVGQTIKINVESYCKKGETITKSNVAVNLVIDGIKTDSKNTNNGLVTFEWVATAVPQYHTICAVVQPTQSCKALGRDCKKIKVSGTPLSLAEQKAIESSAFEEQAQLLKQRRTLLRKQLVSPTNSLYTTPYINVGQVITTPLTKLPITTTPTKDKLTGTIIITNPLPTIIPNSKVSILIDGVKHSVTNSFPKTITGISIGNHTIALKSGVIESPSKNVSVQAGKSTLISFIG